MDKTSLTTLEGRGVNKCGITDRLVFFEDLCLSAEGREVWFIRCEFCSFWVQFLCDVEFWLAQLK